MVLRKHSRRNDHEYDHLKRLNLLRTQIPKHDLIVQRYLSGTAVEQDFLAIYAVALGNGFTLKPRKNVSWNRRITAILGRLDKREVRYPGRFLRHLACQDICADDGIRYLMSPQQRRTFLEQYERTNREVAEQYFPELKGELFERADNEDTNWVRCLCLRKMNANASSAVFGTIIPATSPSARRRTRAILAAVAKTRRARFASGTPVSTIPSRPPLGVRSSGFQISRRLKQNLTSVNEATRSWVVGLRAWWTMRIIDHLMSQPFRLAMRERVKGPRTTRIDG